MQPGPVLKWASILLCALAVVFVGKGLRALQEAGMVPIHSLGQMRVDVFGVYLTAETLLAQGFVLVALLGSAWWRPQQPAARDSVAASRDAAAK